MGLLDAILRRKEYLIDKLKRKGAWLPLIELVIPFLIAAGVIVLMYLTLDRSTFTKIGLGMSAYFIPPAGKESVIPLAVGAGVHPALAAFSIAFIDIVVGLFLVWNFDYLKSIPVLGDAIEDTERRGEELLEKRSWVRRFAFIGIVLFVMIPFQGSGAVMSSIIGRMIGMEKYRVFMAITMGALVGCFSIAYFIDIILSVF